LIPERRRLIDFGLRKDVARGARGLIPEPGSGSASTEVAGDVSDGVSVAVGEGDFGHVNEKSGTSGSAVSPPNNDGGVQSLTAGADEAGVSPGVEETGAGEAETGSTAGDSRRNFAHGLSLDDNRGAVSASPGDDANSGATSVGDEAG
jgi:hypothetical protein